MKLTGLQTLYRSMCDQEMGRIKFRYKLNHLVFECLFFADVEPFELVMGCLGHNFAIFVEVRRGFEITPYIEPKATFYALCDALPADLLSMLVPDGFQIVRVPEGLDHDAIAELASEYLSTKNASHHPESEAGRDIGPSEQSRLTAKFGELRAVA